MGGREDTSKGITMNPLAAALPEILTQNWYDENQTWQGTPGGTGPTGTAICGIPDIPGVAYVLPLSDSTLTPSRKTLGTDHWALHSVALLNQIMETRLRKPIVPAHPSLTSGDFIAHPSLMVSGPPLSSQDPRRQQVLVSL